MPHEIQRQRLRHLIASAVLDIWKKETGSVTSVLIEGTICVSSVQGGRTTVIQLSDRFTGLVPDAGNSMSAADGSDFKHDFVTELYSDTVQMNASLRAAVAHVVSRNQNSASDELLHGFPSRDQKDRSANKDRNNNQAGIADAEMPMGRRSDAVTPNKSRSGSVSDSKPESLEYDDDISEIEIDDEESMANEDGLSSNGVGGRSADDHRLPEGGSMRTAPAAHSRQPAVKTAVDDGGSDMDDSAIHDMSMSFNNSHSTSGSNATRPRASDSNADNQRTPVSLGKKRPLENTPTLKDSAESADVIDSQLDGSDLLLSSPQDLTAQVRNVIRQRLMAHKLMSPYEMMMQNASSSNSSATAATDQAGFSSSAVGSEAFNRPHANPAYYRYNLSKPSPPQWSTPMSNSSSITRDSSDLSAAARRLMASPFSPSSPAIGQHHLISPPHIAQSPIQIGLPVASGPAAAAAAAAALQFGASLQNLLGARAAAVAAAAAGTPPLGGGAVGGSRTSSAISSSLPAPGSAEPMALPGAVAAGSDGHRSPAMAADGSAFTSSGSEQKVYRCDYCLKTFLFKSKYHEHLPVHTSARPFQCHLCTRTYKYKYDLRVHLRTHLGIPTKSTVCPFCAGRFATNKLLRQHMRDAHSDDQVTPAQRASAIASATSAGLYETAPAAAAEAGTASVKVKDDEEDSNSRSGTTAADDDGGHLEAAEDSKSNESFSAEKFGQNVGAVFDSAAAAQSSSSPLLASSV